MEEGPRGIDNIVSLKAFSKLRDEIAKGDVDNTKVLLASTNSKGKDEVKELTCIHSKLRKMQEIMRKVDSSKMRSRAKINMITKSFVPMIHCPGAKLRMAFFPSESCLACVIDTTTSGCLEAVVTEHGLESKIPICAYCATITEGRKKCGVCRTFYCDAHCQRQHWPVHRCCCEPTL